MIRTTLVSHACLLIQTKNLNILTDPVFFDPHWEGINVMCPQREIDFKKFPNVDVLYLSHRHQDHFDVRTLAFLRESNILSQSFNLITPNDPVLIKVLDSLGYPSPRISRDFESFCIKNIHFTPTPSLIEADFPEHGLIIHDGEVTIWNQVDTIVNPDIISYMKKHHPPIDLMHSRFLPLLEGNFTFHQALNLPFEEYSSFLKVVKALGPKFVVPGSAGFRYCNSYGFLNQYSFPTSQEQYLSDISLFCPETKRSAFNPGDIAEICPDGISVKTHESDFVHILEDDSYLIEFKPLMQVDPIKNFDLDLINYEVVHKEIVDFVENQLIESLNKCKLLEVWKGWKVVYQLEVFNKKGTDIWCIDFGSELRVQKGRLGRINVYEGIGCTELYELLHNKTNWDFIGVAAQYRTFHNVYRIENGVFESFPQGNKFPQPLMEVFPEDEKMTLEKYMKDVKKWKRTP